MYIRVCVSDYKGGDSKQYLVLNHTLDIRGHNSGEIVHSLTLIPGKKTLVVMKWKM